MDPFSKSQLTLRNNSGNIIKPGEDGTLVILLLDRSGSMQEHGQTPRISANENLQQLKSMPGAERTQMSIWTFAHDATVDIPPQPLLSIEELKHYEASGGTALYHVVGEALRTGLEFEQFALEAYGSRISVAISVITDGHDTDPKRHQYHPRCLAFAKHAREHGFNLGVIGIGVDGPHIARQIGFEPGYSHSVENSQQGVRSATEHSSVLFSVTMMGAQPPPSSDPPSSDSR